MLLLYPQDTLFGIKVAAMLKKTPPVSSFTHKWNSSHHHTVQKQLTKCIQPRDAEIQHNIEQANIMTDRKCINMIRYAVAGIQSRSQPLNIKRDMNLKANTDIVEVYKSTRNS